ncbi:MAG TPA: hypothetical protein VMT11_00225 [Myxococcaceae bacterium]|nr:hypothetical protein [Myxococcaceae bacterium]
MRIGRCETTLLLFLQAMVAARSAAEESGQSRARASSNAEYGIVMRVEAEGKCRVEVTRDTDVAWTLPRCVGSVDDLYFVSNSGERFWVFAALPKALPPPRGSAPVGETAKRAAKKKPPFDPYGSVVVAVLYDRLGNVVGERRLSELLPSAAHRKLRVLDRRFVWLEGVLGVPGKEPRVNDRNQVEFESVEPRTWRLDFQE